MKRLTIDLADRSYDILIGRNLLPQTATLLTETIQPSRVIIVTHPSIDRLYGESVGNSLRDSGFSTTTIKIPEGESSKSLTQAEVIYDSLIEQGCDRKSMLIALGGGVIGDLTGFTAATYMRGIPFCQVPTTLLSQVDSSVGGKTGVNHPRGKNMIGAFYQPVKVLIDLETLRSLPPREFKAGLAEIVKHGVIANAELFEYLETHAQKILNHDTHCLEHIIATSCAIKASVVERDEKESRYRMVLNFGHTLGHAIEALSGYSQWTHGEAVSMGMVYAATLSQAAGKCPKEVPARLIALLKKLELPTDLPPLDVQELVKAMYLDKKTMHQQLTFVMTTGIGSVEIVDNVAESMVKKVLTENASASHF